MTTGPLRTYPVYREDNNRLCASCAQQQIQAGDIDNCGEVYSQFPAGPAKHLLANSRLVWIHCQPALLGLVPLADRRKNHRVSLLMRILQDDQHHGTLSSGYDEIVNDRASSTMVTRAASCGEPISLGSSTKNYHGSFCHICDIHKKVRLWRDDLLSLLTAV